MEASWVWDYKSGNRFQMEEEIFDGLTHNTTPAELVQASGGIRQAARDLAEYADENNLTLEDTDGILLGIEAWMLRYLERVTT